MTDSPDPHVRPFADWLREQSSGRTHDELTDGLAELVRAVKDTGKKGVLTLTISIAPFDKATTNTLTVTDVVKVALPQHDRRKSIFYGDDAGNLTRENPLQPTFEGLREVPASPTRTDRKEQRA
ncbi:hypothetical protein OEB99_16675 [Actinotalea sp. M2MS4P-6]|uniref:hypothetical protein n=1 Tax=Actinotalea sp. M2MS4P-6 TaxID=2983762 RepID=UPI0021E3BE25|nr:hypothetical protein [Actinotalea sp. M2MS4P-6]MCV2395952.1 hypothetical protein [Actinotalea sp. M2MS4P-6]